MTAPKDFNFYELLLIVKSRLVKAKDMLHALTSRKLRIRQLLSGGSRVPFEDIITSTVFGPIQFMSPKDQRAIVGAITAGSGLALLPETEIGVTLWPKLTTNKFRRRFVEPDVVFEVGAKAKVIMEIKWNAPLSKYELAAQWAALDKTERAESLHILLVREPNRYRQSISEDADILREVLGESSWNRQRRAVSWRDMARAIRMLDRNGSLSPGACSWAQKAAILLSSEEFGVQVGWSEIGLRGVAEAQSKFCGTEMQSA